MGNVIEDQIAELGRLTVTQLRQKYAEVFGEETRSNNKQFLYRRIAWRIQAVAEGGLSERARRRALEIANDADLRIRAPKKNRQEPGTFLKVSEKLRPQDPRLPAPGSWLERVYRGNLIAMKVRLDGGATTIRVQRGYESSTPASWLAGARMKKLPPVSGFQSDVEWGATISNIAVTGDASLKVGGDSERIEESDARCKYTGFFEDYRYGAVGWPSQWWSKGHAKRTGPNDIADVRAVTIQYSATEEHDLYLGTFLNTDCGKVGVTVDGVAPAESPVDLYLNEYGGTTANVKIASAVPAGNHTAVLTALFARNAASTGYYFYFDYLWPLVPQDVPDPQKDYPDVSLAIDFDTDHGYKKPPAWHLWHLQKLGFNGHADVYMGVFWNNKRRRVGATYPYATIEYRLADGVAAPVAGDYVTAIVGGSSMQHKIIEGESLQDVVNWMRVLLNQFSGVWADNDYGSSTTLRIQSKAPSWTYPDVYVDTGIAVLPGVVNEPFAITAGVNDALLFTFDGDGGPQVSVTLSAGAARTGAEVAGEIEAAFEAAGAPATAQAVSFGQQWIESTHPIKVEGTACATFGFDSYQRTPSSVMATLAEVVEDHGARTAAQPAEGLFVEFGPDACTGLEGQQAHGLAAVAQGENEHAGAAVAARVRVTDHGAAAVIDLGLFAGRSDDDRAGLAARAAPQLADEAFDALVAAGEAVVIDQVLVNGLGVATLAERELDEVEVRLADAGGGAPTRHGNRVRVGGHLVGRF